MSVRTSSSSSSSSSSSAFSSSSIPRAAALTPSSAYELGLGYLKRRVNNGYPFKPGHCLVSSYAESLKFDMDILASPREVRYAISIPMTLASSSPVALVDSASPNLRLCFQSRRILSAVLTDCMNNFNLDEALRQWRSLKRETRRLPFFKSCDYVQFWEHIATHYDTGGLTGYSEILILALVVLLIILDTSCCERSFALMNRIHTYLRNRLGVATLNNLMCICSLGPSIMNFDPKLILAKWLEAPFMQKNGRGRSLQGKLNALMGAGSS